MKESAESGNDLSTPQIEVWWAYQMIAGHLILGLRGWLAVLNQSRMNDE